MDKFPTPYMVGHRVWSPDSENDWGDTTSQWADPIDKPVIGWGAPVSSEPFEAGHDRVIVDVQLLVPPGFECSPKDRMVLNGREYEVIGEPATNDGNPFGWNPGGVVNLKRVTG